MLDGKEKRGKTLCGIAAICLIVAFLMGTVNVSSEEPSVAAELSASSYVSHGPISLNGDLGLLQFSQKTGTGSEGDPFVISGLSIDINCWSWSGIEISGLHRFYLVIDGCEFAYTGTYPPYQHGVYPAGIRISDSAHVQIKSCVMSNLQIGIRIDRGEDMEILDNTIEFSTIGILTFDTSDSYITGNTVRGGSRDGIVVYNGDNVQVTGSNTVEQNGEDGVQLAGHSTGCVVSGNDINENGLFGISLTDACTGNSITGNTLVNNFKSIQEYTACTANTLAPNSITEPVLPDAGSPEAYLVVCMGDICGASCGDVLYGAFMETSCRFKPENVFYFIPRQIYASGCYNEDWAELGPIFDHLRAVMDTNDKLFLYNVLHGSTIGCQGFTYWQYNGQQLNQGLILQDVLDKLRYGEQYIVSLSCFGGVLADEYLSQNEGNMCLPNRYIITAAPPNDVGYFSDVYDRTMPYVYPHAYSDAGINILDDNEDGFIDFPEWMDSMILTGGRWSDGIDTAADPQNAIDIIQPCVAGVSGALSIGDMRLDVSFTVDGIGQVASIVVDAFDESGIAVGEATITGGSIRPNGGQGVYSTIVISTTTPIVSYGISVDYQEDEGDEPGWRDLTWSSDRSDADLDGVTDIEERIKGMNVFSADTDADGMPDGWERFFNLDPKDAADASQDLDGDGLTNLAEFQLTGGFLVRFGDPRHADSDFDGMPDGWEVLYGQNPLYVHENNLDVDGDGLTSPREYFESCDPTDPDSDDDGILDGVDVDPDNAASDSDGDGLNDVGEMALGTDPLDPDTDGDGMGDGWEVDHLAEGFDPLVDQASDDTDGDGLTNAQELVLQTNPANPDSDGDTISDGDEVAAWTNPLCSDTDGDGLDDAAELALGLNPSQADSDWDGLLDGEEIAVGANPLDPDSDDDLLPDGWEIDNGLSPITNDATGDLDCDGISNGDEYTLGTRANDADSDDDGLTDGVELSTGTDPLNPDSDNDGLLDGDELARECNPMLQDTDGDGLPDGWEVDCGLDPTAVDSDLDSVADGDEDLDLDGLDNADELALACDPLNPDSDGDWLLDGQEVNLGTSPVITDSDGDQLPDGYEMAIGTDPLSVDSDLDTIMDAVEVFSIGTDPLDPDTDEDGLSDSEEIYTYYTDPLNADTDRDGLTDGDEVDIYCTNPLLSDSDSDGLSDRDEVEMYFTLPLVNDTDGDGLWDGDEITRGADPFDPDTDGDGLLDGVEVHGWGTSPLISDSDGDGLQDGDEVTIGTNPADADCDDDGLWDGDEITIGTNPIHPDTDFDNLLDGAEVGLYYTDPLDADSDGDGLPDGTEVTVLSTDPNDPDTDGDGMGDFWEWAFGLDPLVDDSADDPDGDDLSNLSELSIGTAPNMWDTDYDGLYDGMEVYSTFTDPTDDDTDGDGLGDGQEVNSLCTDPTDDDSDGDGLGDGTEDLLHNYYPALFDPTVPSDYWRQFFVAPVPDTVTVNILASNWNTFDDDGDFTTVGCPGSGTENDPYIIEGRFFLSNSIEFWGITSYFTIRHSWSVAGMAISMTGSSNGMIENCVFMGSGTSISLSSSTSMEISRNHFYDFASTGLSGISCASSSQITIDRNQFRDLAYTALSISGSSSAVTVVYNDFVACATTVEYSATGTGNVFDQEGLGNYWSDYAVRYPSATNDGRVWNIPYVIESSLNIQDNFPAAMIMPYNVEPYDFDGDRVSDDAEILLGLDPLDPDSNVAGLIKDCDPAVVFRIHDVIRIWNDNCFTSASGVVRGSGTQQDPYIIEGWVIASADWAGIVIWSTSAYFILRQCIIVDQGGLLYGIYISSSQHATVESCHVEMQGWFGMVISGSSSAEIAGNVFEGGNTAIYTSGVCSSIFHDNSFYGQSHFSIQVSDGSSNNLFYGNDFITKTVIINSGGGSGNQWNTAELGNYWGDYTTWYPEATNDGTFWDTPFMLHFNFDQYDYKPLVNPGFQI